MPSNAYNYPSQHNARQTFDPSPASTNERSQQGFPPFDYRHQQSQNNGAYAANQPYSASNTYFGGHAQQTPLGNLAYASNLTSSLVPDSQQTSSHVTPTSAQTMAHNNYGQASSSSLVANGVSNQTTSNTQRYQSTAYQPQSMEGLTGQQPSSTEHRSQTHWGEPRGQAGFRSPTMPQRSQSVTLLNPGERSTHGRFEAPSQTSASSHGPGGVYDRSIHNQHRTYSPANGSLPQSSGGRAAPSPAPYVPVTVDPSHVYDPYHEYQRRAGIAQEAARARLQEKMRLEEEEKRAEEAKKVAEAKKVEEMRKNEASAQQSKIVATGRTTSMQSPLQGNHVHSAQETPSLVLDNPSGEKDEAEEIKAMFVRMRQLQERNPALLASVWEEERRTHGGGQGKGMRPVVTNLQPPHTSNESSTPQISTGQLPSTANTSRTITAKSRGPSTAITGTNQAASLLASRLTQHQHQRQLAALALRSSNTGTIWPPEKRESVAEAGVKLLKAIPENTAIPIRPDEICAMLDLNPSYIDLCEYLESLGFKFDRAIFARQLLKVCPDLNSAAVRAYAPASEAPSHPIQPMNMPQQDKALGNDNQLASKGPKISQGLSNPVIDLTAPENGTVETFQNPQTRSEQSSEADGSRAIYSSFPESHRTQSNGIPSLHLSPYFPQPQTGAPTADSARKPPVAVMSTTPTNKNHMPPPAPPYGNTFHNSQKLGPLIPGRQLSKAEMAKKRTFGEVVDLTQAVSDEETDVESPAKRHEPDLDSISRAVNGNQPTAPALSAPPISVPPAPEHPLRSALLVEPLRKSKALRRSTYNPVTIARDVLLATGRHPDMRALNAHLESLRFFKSVTNDSDLGTFKWDLVDPGEPTPIRPKTRIPSVQQNEDADDEAEDGEDGEGLSPPARAVRQAVAVASDGVHIHEAANGSTARASAKSVKIRAGRPPRHSYPGMRTLPSGFVNSNDLSGPFTSGGQRSGQQDADGAPRQSSTPQRSATSSSHGTSGRNAAAYSGGGYAAFREQLSADGTPLPKKRGRPVGWRKSIGALPTTSHQGEMPHRARPSNVPIQPSGLRNAQTPSDGIEVAIPSPGSGNSGLKVGAPKRRGRPPRSEVLGPEPEVLGPEPVYHVYKCKWKGCTAELHNLDTLRRHVFQIHGKQTESCTFLCLWGSCERSTTTSATSQSVSGTHMSFEDMVEWKAHVEKEHLTPIAWVLGDGPAAGLSEHPDSDLSESYLSDSHGRQVTPRVTLQVPRSQSQSESTPYVTSSGWTAVPSGSSSGMGRAGGERTTTTKETAREELKRLEKKKKAIGPGIDRGGSKLANDKRRAGFIDDEDFEMEVDADED